MIMPGEQVKVNWKYVTGFIETNQRMPIARFWYYKIRACTITR